ncbi:MAG TPA: CAP domain-containing protein [Gemmataceae bacterium]|nr:CAP domain-containing protein [Gemmataceae bacterium]
MPGYACPHCRKSFTAPAGPTAAQVLCPHCRQPVEVPATAATRWFLARNKKKVGPYTFQQLQTLARRGEVGPDDLLLQEGNRKWQRAATVRQLFVEKKQLAENPAPRRSLNPTLLAMAAGLVCLLIGAVLIAGYAILNPKPADSHQANLDKVADDPKKSDEGPPKKVDGGPKKDDAPKPDDKKKTDARPQPKQDPRAEAGADAILAQLNGHRQSAGLGNVAMDDDLSRGCLAHAMYLARNIEPTKADGSNVYQEDAQKPGYTEDGERAARNAMVSFAEPTVALERWMGRLLSRIALLSPEMQSIGVGVTRNTGGHWIVVVDPVRGRGEPVVVYPAPRQADVPMSFGVGPEVPDKTAAGFPITITFPANKKVTAASIELHDDKGTNVDGWVWTPENPFRERRQHNTVTLIPKAMLHANTVYQVKANAQLDGQPWQLAWSFTTEDDADGKGVWAAKALVRVNAYRATAGLKPVMLDNTMSQACLKHARYLVINEGNPALEGLNAHDEDLKLPGATPEGKQAGLNSDIAIGDFAPLDGLDAWMATLYHRVPILEPNLERIGFACARGRRGGWVTLLNVSGRKAGDRPFPVIYPADNQTNVPLNFANSGEIPNPIPEDKTGKAGYPVTAVFPYKAPLKNAVGTITDSQGKQVPCWFSSPEKVANPIHAKRQGTTVCLIPKAPLPPNATFNIHVHGQLAGKAWEKRWKFTTGGVGTTASQARDLVFQRINHYRALAGLSAVTPDDKLGRGCQLHAEYLASNALTLANNKSSPNDEDPLLPGYTLEGMRAARQSDVFTNAPTPIFQIDDVMATFSRRTFLLDPTLQRVGFGCAHDIGRGWRCVLDLNGGRGDDRILIYPAPNQRDVPAVGFDRIEGAAGSPGFPISVVFPRQLLPKKAVAVLKDAAGNDIPIAVTSPEMPLNEKFQRNAVGVHPLAPLRAGESYTVTVAAIISGSEWRQEWQFTTK